MLLSIIIIIPIFNEKRRREIIYRVVCVHTKQCWPIISCLPLNLDFAQLLSHFIFYVSQKLVTVGAIHEKAKCESSFQ